MRTTSESGAALAIACIVLAVGMTAGVAVVYIKVCEPKYYCVTNRDQPYPMGKKWVKQLKYRGQASAEDLLVLGGPWTDYELAVMTCHTNTNTVSISMDLAGDGLVHIERSTNLVNWQEVGAVPGDENGFEYWETNAALSGQAFFYRARID